MLNKAYVSYRNPVPGSNTAYAQTIVDRADGNRAKILIASNSIRHANTEPFMTDYISGARFIFGSVGDHAKGLIGTLIHEEYHKEVDEAEGFKSASYHGGYLAHGDTDKIPDVEEITPGSPLPPETGLPPLVYPADPSFPHSKAGKPDTYGVAETVGSETYNEIGDQELRCRILQYRITSTNSWQIHYIVSKDWSAVEKNSNW